MSKMNTEEEKLKIGELSRKSETLRTLSARTLEEVLGGNMPSIPIPPPSSRASSPYRASRLAARCA